MSGVNNPNARVERFRLDLNDSVIWNKKEFLEFLIQHQDKVIHVEIPEGVCLKSVGVYELMKNFTYTAVNIRSHNIIESTPYPYKFELSQHAWQYFDVHEIDKFQQYHAWNQKYVFGALYNRPSWHRIGITGTLLEKYPRQSLINFRYSPSDHDSRNCFELDRLFQADPTSVTYFSKNLDLLPMRLEKTDGWTMGATTNEHTTQLAEFYPNFLIDIVCETFVHGRSFYPTEKTIRPMILKKPFIVVGPKCFLIHLRQMGFKTFYEYWDETYDGYDPNPKYLKILKIIESIANKSNDELVKMYSQMQPILEHNYNLLLEKKFIKKVEYVE